MAAPLMWFGERFYKIIPKDRLVDFSYSSLTIISSIELISIKLFDIYDLPEKQENRQKQKEFWIYFNLNNVIEVYKQTLEIAIKRSREDFF